MASSDPIKPLLYALQDSVMLLLPMGWTTVRLTLVPHGRMLRLAETEVKGDGAKEPERPPDLGVDVHAEAFRLSEGLTELVERLREKGKDWSPGVVELSRAAGACDWKLVRADGSVAWFTRLEPKELDALLVSDAMLKAVRGTERAFSSLQASLEASLGRVEGFSYSAADGALRIDREGRGHVHVFAELVGRYDLEHFTWTWSWADRSSRSVRVWRVCAPEAQTPGLAAFWRDGFHCDEPFAFALAGHVAVSLGASGLFRAEVPDAKEVLLFALEPKAS